MPGLATRVRGSSLHSERKRCLAICNRSCDHDLWIACCDLKVAAVKRNGPVDHRLEGGWSAGRVRQTEWRRGQRGLRRSLGDALNVMCRNDGVLYRYVSTCALATGGYENAPLCASRCVPPSSLR